MIALELFTCSGGMGSGFKAAGIEFAFAFDKSPEACASYEANLGHRPVCIDATDLLRLVQGGWRPTAGPLDLIVADPPCTPWSRAGKRKGSADARDMMGQTCELIRLLRPRAYLIGNVLAMACAWAPAGCSKSARSVAAMAGDCCSRSKRPRCRRARQGPRRPAKNSNGRW